MTRSRYPGNPDYHEVPARCEDCGRFVGSMGSEAATLVGVWEVINPHDDLFDIHACRCLDCATDRAMERLGTDDRTEALHAVLGAITG